MTRSKGKVLFLYPNSEGLGGVPNGIALLSGCLKQAGFETSSRYNVQNQYIDIVKGVEFKKALFSIWLGSTPADATLKKGMLGKN